MEAVTALLEPVTEKGKRRGIEENVSALYRYGNGIIAAAECGWCAAKYQTALEVHGTKGSLLILDDRILYHSQEEGWQEIEEDSLPEAMPYPLYSWLDGIRGGAVSGYCGIEEAVCLTRMLTAAQRSGGNLVLL